jgi:hypothetical protein
MYEMVRSIVEKEINGVRVIRPDIGVIGGGLLGRCLAWRASKGWCARRPLRCGQQRGRRLSRMGSSRDDRSNRGIH